MGVDGKIYAPVGDEAEVGGEGSDEDAPGSLTEKVRQEIRDTIRQSFATVESSNFALRYDDTRDLLVLVESKGGKSVYRIGEYIAFISRLVLVFGISFQLPVVVSILVKLELLTARVMRSTRTYAWIIILVSAAILTPPDLMTLALLGGPMIILYEICIIIASIIERKREKKLMAEEQAKMTRLEQLYAKNPDDLSEEEKAEIHKAEIEQYEKEHAHLYDDEHGHDNDGGETGETVARDSYLGQEHDGHYDFDADHAEFDESWHENEQGFHEGYEDKSTRSDEDSKTAEDLHDRENGATESDRAQKEEVESGAAETEEKSPEQPQDDGFYDDDACAPSGPVIDINHASADDLQTLPGIGPKLAEAIIDHRPFETFDDLENVPGLSPDKVNAMIDRLMLG